MNLLFVYNAKSDLLNATIDFAHKIISPKTYACDLCQLTHGNFGERKSWKEFVKGTNIQMSFLHINEFEKQFNTSYEYPIVLSNTKKGLSVMLDAESISTLKNADELILSLKTKVKI